MIHDLPALADDPVTDAFRALAYFEKILTPDLLNYLAFVVLQLVEAED